MDLEDKQIICEDCSKEFTHTVEDQKRYAERGFTEAPKRCRECRQARKERSAAQQTHGGEARRPGGRDRRAGGSSRGFQGGHRPRRDFPSQGGSSPGHHHGGSDRPPRQSFDAICAACGTPTTVPFEPRPGREVFCRDCFRKMREG